MRKNAIDLYFIIIFWSNGQSTQIYNGLWGDPSGQGIPFTHTVTITDDNGCSVNNQIDIVNYIKKLVEH